MRMVLGRRGWSLAVASVLGMTATASAQPAPRSHVVPVQEGAQSVRGPLSEESARLIEMKVQLAWLNDPVTAHYPIGAHCHGSTLQVVGYVPTDIVHKRALQVAQQQSGLAVVDNLKLHGNMSMAVLEPHSPEALQQAAARYLGQLLGENSRSIMVQARPDGHLTLVGMVGSYDEKLRISQSLARMAGCTCVENRMAVATVLRDGKPYARITKDGRLWAPDDGSSMQMATLPTYSAPQVSRVATPVTAAPKMLPPATGPAQPVAVSRATMSRPAVTAGSVSQVATTSPAQPMPPAKPRPVAVPPAAPTPVAVVPVDQLPPQPQSVAGAAVVSKPAIRETTSRPGSPVASTATASSAPGSPAVPPKPSDSHVSTAPSTSAPVALVNKPVPAPASPIVQTSYTEPAKVVAPAMTAATPAPAVKPSAAEPVKVTQAASQPVKPATTAIAPVAQVSSSNVAKPTSVSTPSVATASTPAVSRPVPAAQPTRPEPQKPLMAAAPTSAVAIATAQPVGKTSSSEPTKSPSSAPAVVAVSTQGQPVPPAPAVATTHAPAPFPVPDSAVTSSVNRGAAPAARPALPSSTAVVQASWTEPAKPTLSVAATPTPVAPAMPERSSVGNHSTSGPRAGEAYVTAGVIRWDDEDDSPAAARPGHSLAALKECVTKACGGLARDIEVSEASPGTLVVALRAAAGVEPQQLTPAILSLEELDNYRVTLKWK